MWNFRERYNLPSHHAKCGASGRSAGRQDNRVQNTFNANSWAAFPPTPVAKAQPAEHWTASVPFLWQPWVPICAYRALGVGEALLAQVLRGKPAHHASTPASWKRLAPMLPGERRAPCPAPPTPARARPRASPTPHLVRPQCPHRKTPAGCWGWKAWAAEPRETCRLQRTRRNKTLFTLAFSALRLRSLCSAFRCGAQASWLRLPGS